jgi:hypothetical protein
MITIGSTLAHHTSSARSPAWLGGVSPEPATCGVQHSPRARAPTAAAAAAAAAAVLSVHLQVPSTSPLSSSTQVRALRLLDTPHTLRGGGPTVYASAHFAFACEPRELKREDTKAWEW